MFSAEVPLAVATAYTASCAAANAASNRPVYGPRVSAPLARISVTAAAISARSAGGNTTRAAGTPNGRPLARSCRGPTAPRLVIDCASGIVPTLPSFQERYGAAGVRPRRVARMGPAWDPHGTRPRAGGYEAGVTGVLRQRGPAGARRARRGGAGARRPGRRPRRPGRDRDQRSAAAVLPPAGRAGPGRSRGGHLR